MANSYWYERPTVEQARAMLVTVLPELPISDVTAKNQQRLKQQLKWSSGHGDGSSNVRSDTAAAKQTLEMRQ
ncbi:hypothetical protein F443_01794 [Phytophthora nicotianae P1569]|uniref:Uncharacterized protein n=1 Tax=Phytophthora nicotianae P1569 TaxID=1317065 RepID=V9FVL4_PHYNI|nr:hypothetical protein F443_01794 [Phytophthora nicotianae P1569]